MDDREYRAAEGSCIISEDVIASIASSAALEVPGVAGMAQRPADLRGFIGQAGRADSGRRRRGAAQRQGGRSVHDRQAGKQGQRSYRRHRA